MKSYGAQGTYGRAVVELDTSVGVEHVRRSMIFHHVVNVMKLR